MWIETSKEVYSVIFAKHGDDLCVHSSFTDATGYGYHYSNGKPTAITEWGFKKAENPLIKVEQEKENESDKKWNNKYFIRF